MFDQNGFNELRVDKIAIMRAWDQDDRVLLCWLKRYWLIDDSGDKTDTGFKIVVGGDEQFEWGGGWWRVSESEGRDGESLEVITIFDSW